MRGLRLTIELDEERTKRIRVKSDDPTLRGLRRELLFCFSAGMPSLVKSDDPTLRGLRQLRR